MLDPDDVLFPLLMDATADLATHFKVQAAMGLAGRIAKRHVGLPRGTVSLLDVATDTGSHHIFPAISPTSGAG